MATHNTVFKLLCEFNAWLKIRTDAQRHMDRLQVELRRAQTEIESDKTASGEDEKRQDPRCELTIEGSGRSAGI